MPFNPAITPPTVNTNPSLWFLFNNNKLLVNFKNDIIAIPCARHLSKLNLNVVRHQYLGTLDETHCYSGELADNQVFLSGLVLRALRGLFELLSEELYAVAGLAAQIVTWDQNHQYCGRCGAPMETKSDERVKVCPKCKLVDYPAVSPCIIVAVIKGKEVLLARSPHWKPGWYSVIAGFVEPGETLEECVKREVREEVNIEVEKIRYFGNQPWPYPHTLMIAFIADYASGEISIDQNEIEDAGWYAKEKLPNLPSRAGIARKLVDWYLENRS